MGVGDTLIFLSFNDSLQSDKSMKRIQPEMVEKEKRIVLINLDFICLYKETKCYKLLVLLNINEIK